MCGENNFSDCLIPLRKGSPPRVRGKLHAVPCAIFRERITPACAGKTKPPALKAFSKKDHPRVCGENIPITAGADFSEGSPPRVRGKPSQYVVM